MEQPELSKGRKGTVPDSEYDRMMTNRLFVRALASVGGKDDWETWDAAIALYNEWREDGIGVLPVG
jgi:hypothetical protein